MERARWRILREAGARHRGEVTVSLAVDQWGEPDLTAAKGERPLKAIRQPREDARITAL